MDFQKKRWISLVAGIFIELFSGVGYAFSVFVLPLSQKYGWTLSQLALAYTFFSIVMMVAAIVLVPRVRAKMPIRNCILLGAIFYGGGIALSGLTGSLMLFYLFYAVLGGTGLALMYPVLMSYSVEIFPDKRGLASGFMAAGFGLGSMVWALAASKIYEATGDMSRVLNIFGIVFLIGIAILSRFIFTVPEGFRQSLAEKAVDALHRRDTNSLGKRAALSSYSEKNSKEMLKDRLFYMIYFAIICNVICGTMMITQVSPIMQFSFGMTVSQAAVIVSIFAVANTLGRPVWGILSDKFGRFHSIMWISFLMAASMAALYLLQTQSAYIMALVLCALCYGGIASLVAPVTSDLFGHKHLTGNYGFMFTVYGIAGMIAPPVIALVKEGSGGYDGAFLIGTVLCLVGLLLAWGIRKKVS